MVDDCLPFVQDRPIVGIELAGDIRRINIPIGLSDDLISRLADVFQVGAISQDLAPSGIFDVNGIRQIIDDCAQEDTFLGQRRFSAFALGYIICQHQFSGPSRKIQCVPTNFDVDDTAVFLSVAHTVRDISELAHRRRQDRHQIVHIFRGPNLFDRHSEKFVA